MASLTYTEDAQKLSNMTNDLRMALLAFQKKLGDGQMPHLVGIIADGATFFNAATLFFEKSYAGEAYEIAHREALVDKKLANNEFVVIPGGKQD